MSLFAIGGANGAIPEMHRLVVETRGWMTDRQFADMFALAQVTPGPNVIIVALIGYHVAGIGGALVTTRAALAAFDGSGRGADQPGVDRKPFALCRPLDLVLEPFRQA